MKLSKDQDAALNEVINFLSDPTTKEMAISGPAGTGKTVLTKYILEAARKQSKLLQLLLNEYDELNVHLTSTTNKAAKVLSDATGEKAQTIHSLLGLRVVNDYTTGKTKLQRSNTSDIVRNTFIIVDEASMINKTLLRTIQSMTLNCKTLYIGDNYQLAPVKENTSPVFTKIPNQVKLSTIQRQAAGSPIIKFSSKFRIALDTGVFPTIASKGKEVKLLSSRDFQAKLDKAYKKIHDPNDVRVIAWTNKRVHEYNSYIRGLTSKSADYQLGEVLLTNQPIMQGGKTPFYPTDSYGVITKIDHSSRKGINGWKIQLDNSVKVFQAYNQQEVTAFLNQLRRNKEWPDFFKYKEEFADLRPIHANTVNKAQGSTYKTAFIDLTDIGKCTINTDIARLLYTATTRASDQIYMTGALPKRLYQ